MGQPARFPYVTEPADLLPPNFFRHLPSGFQARTLGFGPLNNSLNGPLFRVMTDSDSHVQSQARALSFGLVFSIILGLLVTFSVQADQNRSRTSPASASAEVEMVDPCSDRMQGKIGRAHV